VQCLPSIHLEFQIVGCSPGYKTIRRRNARFEVGNLIDAAQSDCTSVSSATLKAYSAGAFIIRAQEACEIGCVIAASKRDQVRALRYRQVLMCYLFVEIAGIDQRLSQGILEILGNR
jgi:hypothetical protein